jgi:ABC-type phosphate/phosphonate transport system substrate-binding protein/DNA-binding CsgD family transcriptional regulator
MIKKLSCSVFLLGLYAGLGLDAAFAQQRLNIAVLAYDGKATAAKRWQATAEYLSRRIPGHEFVIQPLTHAEIDQSILKRQTDFILTNPGHYVQLESKYGITRLATYKSAFSGQALDQFGAVIIVRADSAIESLEQLRGKRFAAVGRRAFGGYLMALREMQEFDLQLGERIDPQWLGFPQQDIVEAVIAGEEDAGTVRTGIIEQMVAQGKIAATDLRVLAPKRYEGFPLQTSTVLYPEWPFARLSATPQAIAQQVALALLSMDPASQAAKAGGGAGWTIPADYTPVHDLYRALELSPYTPQPASLTSIWREFKTPLAIVLVVFGFGLWGLRYLWSTNRELHRSRVELAQHQGKLEEMVEERTREMQVLNDKLAQDNQTIADNEQEYREAVDCLRAMTETSTRGDLTHQQRLQSIVDIGCRYMHARQVVLSSHSSGAFKVCAVSPADELTPVGPLHPDLVERALGAHEVVVVEDPSNSNLEYRVWPLLATDSLSCVIEMTISATEPQVPQETDLRQQILGLVLQWAANELTLMQRDEAESSRKESEAEQFSGMTAREREVLEKMAQGLGNKAIANELGISVKTVELHRSNLLHKTRMNSSLELIKHATRAGIVN